MAKGGIRCLLAKTILTTWAHRAAMMNEMQARLVRGGLSDRRAGPTRKGQKKRKGGVVWAERGVVSPTSQGKGVRLGRAA
jgi:hypothetical protein